MSASCLVGLPACGTVTSTQGLAGRAKASEEGSRSCSYGEPLSRKNVRQRQRPAAWAEASLQSAKTKAADHAAATAQALTEMNAAIAAAVPAGAPEWISLTARQLENERGIVVELTLDHPTIESWSAREAVREAAGVTVWGYGAALEVEAGVDDTARVIPAILQRLQQLADEATATHRAREAARDAAIQLLIAKGISLKG